MRADNDEIIIDDTFKYKKPMELIIGKKFKLEIWELILHTMRLNERSKYVIPKAVRFNFMNATFNTFPFVY